MYITKLQLHAKLLSDLSSQKINVSRSFWKQLDIFEYILGAVGNDYSDGLKIVRKENNFLRTFL